MILTERIVASIGNSNYLFYHGKYVQQQREIFTIQFLHDIKQNEGDMSVKLYLNRYLKCHGHRSSTQTSEPSLWILNVAKVGVYVKVNVCSSSW